jgi:hypothetical protein
MQVVHVTPSLFFGRFHTRHTTNFINLTIMPRVSARHADHKSPKLCNPTSPTAAQLHGQSNSTKPHTKNTLFVFSTEPVCSAASIPHRLEALKFSFPLPNQTRDDTHPSSPHDLHYSQKLMEESHHFLHISPLLKSSLHFQRPRPIPAARW